jgi:glycosyltransferase involved in cell wall biosynthesis
MRVTIDATSTLLRSAGVKNYTYHWLRHLRQAAAPGDEFHAFPYVGELGPLDHERSMLSLPATWARLALVNAANLFGSSVLDAAISGSDVFHAGNLVRRAPRRARLTATVHDLTCWLLPEHHTAATASGDHLFAERILKHADGLIAVSENTRQDAIRLLDISPEKIRTIHSGVPEEYFCAQPARGSRPYVLYVGTIEPRKNLPALLDAWRDLKPDLRQQYELVIAGPQGWRASETMERIRAEVTYAGYVPEARLPGLTAGATVFVYPSLYEGFGFPVVQAMAAGVPVLTSCNSCMPEVTGGAALLVDPRSTAEISGALERLLESESERARLAEAGRARAQRFRWERCAAESLKFFEEIAGR